MLDEQGITFRVTKTIDFKVNIQIRPLDCIGTAHLNVQNIFDRCFAEPWQPIIRQEEILPPNTNHNPLCINH